MRAFRAARAVAPADDNLRVFALDECGCLAVGVEKGHDEPEDEQIAQDDTEDDADDCAGARAGIEASICCGQVGDVDLPSCEEIRVECGRKA